MPEPEQQIAPRVFISYSHDSPEHEDRVLTLADRLRLDGIDALIDQYDPAPPDGWPMWMEREIQKADFVAMVCTETYLTRVERRESPGKGRGVLWEAKLIYNLLYLEDPSVQRFIPLLFTGGETFHIPCPTRGSTYYQVDSEIGYEHFYRHITGQPRHVKPEVGKLRALPTIAPQSYPPATKPVEQVITQDDPRIYLEFDPDWGKQAEHLGLSTPILLTNRGGSDAHEVTIEPIRLRATNVVFETPVPVIAKDETKKVRPVAAPTGMFRSNLIRPLNDEWESYKSLAKETVEIPVRVTYKTFAGKPIETRCVLVFNGIIAALNQNHRKLRNPVSFHNYAFTAMSEAEAAQNSAKAFERIADAAHGQLRAMKDKDRPRLTVEMTIPEAMPEPFPLIGNQSAVRVRLAIYNQGPTDAFNVKVRAFYVTVADRAGRDNSETGWLQEAPGIIGNTKQAGPVMVSIRIMGFRNEEFDGDSSVDSVAVSPDLLQKLKEGQRFIQASGLITYTDTYDDPHETPFDFVWRSTGNYVSTLFWGTESYWFDRSARSS